MQLNDDDGDGGGSGGGGGAGAAAVPATSGHISVMKVCKSFLHLLMQLTQESLKGESVMAAILPSCMDLPPFFFFRS